MPSEHFELVQRAADAIRRADVEALMQVCTEDVVFIPVRSALQGGYVGSAGFRRWFADTAETFDVFTPTWTEMIEAGEHAVIIGHITIRPRGGPETTIRSAFVVTFENGKIARAEDLRDRSTALASVGLPG